jgi:DNA-binding beta-propeller fold protein YncE
MLTTRPRPTGMLTVLLALLAVLTVAPAAPSGAGAPLPPRCLEPLGVTDLGPDGAYGMNIDADTGYLYVAVDGEGRVDVLDGVTNAVIDSIPVPDDTIGFPLVDSAHDTLWVGSFSADKVYAIDLDTEALIDSVDVESPQSMALNRGTNRLYVAGQTNDVIVVNTLTHDAVGTLPVGGHSLGLAVDGVNNRIFVGDYTNDTLDVFDGSDNTLEDDFELPGSDPITVVYDRLTGSVWVTTRAPGHVTQIDPDTGALGTTFTYTEAQGLDINPSLGQGYVAESSGNVLTAFNLTDGSVIDTYPIGQGNLVIEARVDPLRVYAAGYDDGTVTVIGPGDGPFTDVPGTHPFCFDIEWLASEEVTTGFPDGTYRPKSPVTRQSMAAFLYRFAGEPPFDPPDTATFPDVPTTDTFYDEIEWLASTEITGGYPDGTFRPTTQISRQSMAAFLYRFAGEPAFVPPFTPTFDDVPADSQFYDEVEWLASTGITGGFPDGTFRPGSSVTRQSMAAFLHRYAMLDV